LVLKSLGCRKDTLVGLDIKVRKVDLEGTVAIGMRDFVGGDFVIVSCGDEGGDLEVETNADEVSRVELPGILR
jgi:hypothetical protein